MTTRQACSQLSITPGTKNQRPSLDQTLERFLWHSQSGAKDSICRMSLRIILPLSMDPALLTLFILPQRKRRWGSFCHAACVKQEGWMGHGHQLHSASINGRLHPREVNAGVVELQQEALDDALPPFALYLCTMSHFWSLDDDDDGEAGPSDQGSQLGAGLASPSPSSRANTTPRGNAASSSSNPIYAMLNGQAEGSTSARNVGRDTNGGRKLPQLSDEPPVMRLQRAWISERGCPEILPWRGHAVDDVCSQIEEQMVGDRSRER